LRYRGEGILAAAGRRRTKPGRRRHAGAQALVSCRPDGYTLRRCPITVFRFPHMQKTQFDPSKDFTYVIGLSGLHVRDHRPAGDCRG
jgi:hypothetical protein